MRDCLSRAFKITDHLPNLITLEFFAVILDIKPCLYTEITLDEKNLILSAFPELFIVTKKFEVMGISRLVAFISKDKSHALKAAQSILDVDRLSSGKLFGYPDCCVKKHIPLVADQNIDDRKMIYKIFKNTKTPSFLNNNLLNFSSRVGIDNQLKDQNRYLINNNKLKKDIFGNSFRFFPSILNISLISHIPCSYDCLESIELGEKMAQELKEIDPDFEMAVASVLKRPFLFFNTFNFFIFDGSYKNGELIYEKIIPPFGLDYKNFSESIRLGNRLVIDDQSISIFKNDLLIRHYDKKDEADGFIIDFK